MTKSTKILLAISLGSFLLSFTGALYGQFLPVGAVFFGLFLISSVLSKEAALFDEEQRLHPAMEKSAAPAVRAPRAERGAPANAVLSR